MLLAILRLQDVGGVLLFAFFRNSCGYQELHGVLWETYRDNPMEGCILWNIFFFYICFCVTQVSQLGSADVLTKQRALLGVSELLKNQISYVQCISNNAIKPLTALLKVLSTL